VYNFLKDPNRAPDASFIATMPHIIFATHWLEAPWPTLNGSQATVNS